MAEAQSAHSRMSIPKDGDKFVKSKQCLQMKSCGWGVLPPPRMSALQVLMKNETFCPGGTFSLFLPAGENSPNSLKTL